MIQEVNANHTSQIWGDLPVLNFVQIGVVYRNVHTMKLKYPFYWCLLLQFHLCSRGA